MNLQGKDRIFDTERDDKMSRKSDAMKNKKFNSPIGSEPDDIRDDSYQPPEQDDELYIEEETVDISDFGKTYMAQQDEAESEEAKKVAELMASINVSRPVEKSWKSKRKKNKKSKRSGLFGAEDRDEYDVSEDESEAEIDNGYDDTYDELSADDSEYIPVPSEELDGDFYEDFDEDDKPYSGRNTASDDETDVDFDESIDVDFDNDTYDSEEEYEEEFEEEIDDESAESEYEYENDDETEESEDEGEESDDEDGESVEYEVERRSVFGGKRSLIRKIKDFWLGSEDFEEKFDDDFDPSVFDEEESAQLNSEVEEIDADDEESEAFEESEETEEDEEVSEEEPEADDADEEESDIEDYDDEPDDDSRDDEKSPSLVERLKAFWNGDDIKNRDIDDEEISEEEIEAEVEAAKSEWVKSSVKYGDLSEYAPKERVKADSPQEENNEYDYDADFETESRAGFFGFIRRKVNSFLSPSLGAEDDDLSDDIEYQEEDTDEQAQESAESEQEELDEDEKVKKSSPIQQIKNLWNEDGEYADEDDEEQPDEDDDTLIDAEFNDETEKPVVTKPVLTVIDPSKPEPDDDEEQDNIEQEKADDTETESVQTANAEPEKSADEIDDEDIILEGPDAPVDVVAPSVQKKIGVLGRIKSFWNGGTLNGDDENEGEQGNIPKEPSVNKLKKHFKKDKKAAAKAEKELKAENGNAPVDSENAFENEVKAGNPSAAQPEEVKYPEDDNVSEPPAVAATFDEVAKESFTIDELDGRQIVNGRVVPKYTHESLVDKISLTNENLPLVVRREYEEYIRQAMYRPKADDIPPQVNSEVSKAVREEMNNPGKAAEKAERARKQEQLKEKEKNVPKKQEPKADKRSIKDVLFGSVENSADFSEFRAQTNLNPQNDQVIEDYDKPSDARAIRAEINYDNRKVSFRCITLGIIFAIILVLYIVQRYFTTVLTQNIPNADIMTCLISLVLLLISAVLCHSTVIGGLKPLLAFKGNSDTAVAVAVIGCLAQGVVSFFEPQSFFSGGAHLYAILAVVALLLNNLGKLCIVRRIKANFKFVASPNRKYAARIYEDEEISSQMIDQTGAEKPVVALQSRTRFLKGFLKFSYMPDPSERTASFMAPITTVIAVLIAIICGIINGSVASSISSFALVACMGIPMCCLLAVNIPMKKLCSDALKNRAMIIGYPAVKNFSETRAVMVDSRELYPRGKVQLLSVKTFNTYNIDKALLNAAAVMKVANTPMTYMFEDVISEKGEQLPIVESVKYEDGNGLVSWVDGERLLLGNRELMAKYSINLPSLDFEESSVESRTNCITYLANAGQLVAMLVTDYQADQRLAAELKRLENNGVTILIRTADPNVSQLKVAKDFGIYIRSIKILPTVLGNICKDEMSKREESSRAFISTEGKLHSFARAIGGCIKIKDNISIAIVIQVIAVVLGVLIAGIVSVFAGLNGLNGLDLLFYVVFWAVASIIAPMIQRA